MWYRSIILMLVVLICSSTAPKASATIDVIVSLIDGEVTLHNPELAPYQIIYYSIGSDGDWLLPGGWTPVAVHYDASGDGSVDPDDEWLLLTNPGTTSLLSETELFGNGGILNPDQTVSLGLIWNTSIATSPGDWDLEVEIADFNGDPAVVFIDYRSYDADFNLDLNVDSIDLAIIEANFGMNGVDHSEGDADRNGLVDGFDLLIWHEQLISAPFGSGTGQIATQALGGSVPEPSGFRLTATAIAVALYCRFLKNHDDTTITTKSKNGGDHHWMKSAILIQ